MSTLPVQEISAAEFYQHHRSTTSIQLRGKGRRGASSVFLKGRADPQRRQTEFEIAKIGSKRHNAALRHNMDAGAADVVRVFSSNPTSTAYYDWGSYRVARETDGHFTLCVPETAAVPATTTTTTAVPAAAATGGTTRKSSSPAAPSTGAAGAPPAPKRRRRTSGQMSIPTEYNGVKFRSRLEARIALFMDRVQVSWSYERITLRLPAGNTYTPDFFLPRQNLLVEVKPAFPHVEEMEKCEAVARDVGMRVVLLFGSELGPAYRHINGDGGRFYSHQNAPRGMAWDSQGERIAGDVLFVREAGGTVGLQPVVSTTDTRWDDPIIQRELVRVASHSFA